MIMSASITLVRKIPKKLYAVYPEQNSGKFPAIVNNGFIIRKRITALVLLRNQTKEAMKNSEVNILVIDVDEVFHLIINDFFKSRYPEIHLTNMHRTRDALNHLKKLDREAFPYLIITDLEMPVMDVHEFLEIYDREFYSYHSEIPVIILSISNNQRQLAKFNAFASLREIILKSMLEENLTYILKKVSETSTGRI